ncbi:UPF0481 protein [Acorus calamus]|uniref:UPF0481 protein n=1 Tax=Acorus calamus TaxID=4465 RepID=A0AAV9CR12_ACOCL|nr:UPF0481 protein [Acorus calamus]
MDEEDWVDSLKRRMEEAHCNRQRQDPCSIFRVPANLRRCNLKSYDPTLTHYGPYDPSFVSIGPYHRGKPCLQQVEDLKWRTLRSLLLRNQAVSLERCLEEMKDLEARARGCYSEVVNLYSKDFVEMMLLDGCFVVFVLACEMDYANQAEEDEEEGVLKVWMWPDVKKDLLLLENQIPFFVVKALFQLLVSPFEGIASAEELAIKALIRCYPGRRDSLPAVPSGRIHHLLHLFYKSILPVTETERSHANNHDLLPLYQPKTSTKGVLESIPSAADLKEAGVKFKVKKNVTSFLDVTFRGRVMEIPPLALYDKTESVLRNLIAFERCYMNTGDHVTRYALFMDCLAHGPRDVSILRKEGIIVNWLSGDEEAARMFNQLFVEVAYDPWKNNYLSGLFVEVSRFCGLRQNRWRAKLVRDYFGNPWAIISLGAAVTFLILTFLQTFFAVYSYFCPPS